MLSKIYDPDPYVTLSRKGDSLVLERGDVLLKRNLDNVKRFIALLHQQSVTPQLEVPVRQTPAQITLKPVDHPEHQMDLESAPERLETPVAETPHPGEEEVPKATTGLRRSVRSSKEPAWLKDFLKYMGQALSR